jgi:hypothetical protein
MAFTNRRDLPSRRRLVFAAITPAGRDVVEGTGVVLTSVAHAHIASRPTAAELATLSATLRTIADAPSWQEQITTTVGCAVARRHEPGHVACPPGGTTDPPANGTPRGLGAF